ncbi:MAG: sugar phosphate isomerase/epimerase [Planctomycetes bacterium]|nr:sugar phosphate isomerase/epimerase [Planctomycetota bacterium]
MYVAIRDCQVKHGNFPDIWTGLKALEVQWVEVAVERDLSVEQWPNPDTGKPFRLGERLELKRFEEELGRHNIRVTALLMANRFNEDLEAEVKWGVDCVNLAHGLNAPAVRVDMVAHGEGIDQAAFEKRCVEAAKRILKETRGSGVALAVENHGKIANQPEFLERIFGGVGDERMGLTFDTGNFYWWGYPLEEVYRIMERVAPRARHTHVKNIKYPADKRNAKREIGWEYGTYRAPVYEGDIDHARVAKVLRKAGYDGALTLEDESLKLFSDAERPGVLKKDLDHLRDCIRKAG